MLDSQEYVGRRVQDFDPVSRCIVLNAAMRLRALVVEFSVWVEGLMNLMGELWNSLTLFVCGNMFKKICVGYSHMCLKTNIGIYGMI